MNYEAGIIAYLTSDAAVALEVQLTAAAVTAMVGVGLAFAKKRLNLQASSTASQLEATASNAIQTATANFATQVNVGLAAGTITHETAVPLLTTYLKNSVAGSMALMQPGETQLATILAAKLATLPVAQDVDAAVFSAAAKVL